MEINYANLRILGRLILCTYFNSFFSNSYPMTPVFFIHHAINLNVLADDHGKLFLNTCYTHIGIFRNWSRVVNFTASGNIPDIMHLFPSISAQSFSHNPPELVCPVFISCPWAMVSRIRLQPIQLKQMAIDRHKTYKVICFTCSYNIVFKYLVTVMVNN